ncbi:hypothetical protein [Solimicrobium silvestre]|uniref:Uncharacterized protein n=1 Tax=Solimicrobium silvestre TaxID=2099400 RepID=A0A2S9GYC9_9BURK|nr:hypothetical protein [Solimicrobium silvestre]PRC92723.1 hypothetical protein S2091_2453 [Solimicrobium silvestre]
MDQVTTGIAAIVIFLVITIGIFVICRELVCWYWKINKSIELQQEIAQSLKEIAATLKAQRQT